MYGPLQQIYATDQLFSKTKKTFFSQRDFIFFLIPFCCCHMCCINKHNFKTILTVIHSLFLSIQSLSVPLFLRMLCKENETMCMCVALDFSQRLHHIDPGNRAHTILPFSPRNSLRLDIVSVHAFHSIHLCLRLLLKSQTWFKSPFIDRIPGFVVSRKQTKQNKTKQKKKQKNITLQSRDIFRLLTSATSN